eukprot:CAMPEP_0114264364 /NCGR_PEP_ID=MMETSP0058-20121206/23150_1 /TAXON_ID=36894 /ORGANISM="Pyramimonas parkeae, CCMP726" /LENGTH=108 /DNA_ID=CAMNT_0001380999 /DNA_START=330 /DNA_END=653 /DNA_ORIENTATION=-
MNREFDDDLDARLESLTSKVGTIHDAHFIGRPWTPPNPNLTNIRTGSPPREKFGQRRHSLGDESPIAREVPKSIPANIGKTSASGDPPPAYTSSAPARPRAPRRGSDT